MKSLIVFLAVISIAAAFWAKKTTSKPSTGKPFYPTTSYPTTGKTTYPTKVTTSSPSRSTTSYPFQRKRRSTNCSGCACVNENCPMGNYPTSPDMEMTCMTSMEYFYCSNEFLHQGHCNQNLQSYEDLRNTLLSSCGQFGFTESNPNTILPSMESEDFYSTTTGYPFYGTTESSYSPQYTTNGNTYYPSYTTTYNPYNYYNTAYSTNTYPPQTSTPYPYYYYTTQSPQYTTNGNSYYPSYTTSSPYNYYNTAYQTNTNPSYTTAAYPYNYYNTAYPTNTYPSYTTSSPYNYYNTAYQTNTYPSYTTPSYPNYYYSTAYPATTYPPPHGYTDYPYYYTTTVYPGFDAPSCSVSDLSYCAQKMDVQKYGACSAYSEYVICLKGMIQSCPMVGNALGEVENQVQQLCGSNDSPKDPTVDLPASIDKNSLLAFIQGAVQETRETVSDAEESLQAIEDVVSFIEG